MCPSGTGYNYFLACDTAERIIFAGVTGSGSGKLCWHSRGTDNDQENAGRGMGSFAPPGASSFLSSLKESYQRKPLETTFQDFLGVGTTGANLTVCTRGRGAAVITVGQKDCACVHRRGG